MVAFSIPCVPQNPLDLRVEIHPHGSAEASTDCCEVPPVADALLPRLAPSHTRLYKCPALKDHHSTGQHSQGSHTSFLQTALGGRQSWSLLPREGVQVALSAFHWCVGPAKFPCLNAVVLMSTLLLGPQAPHLASCLPWKSLHQPASGTIREKPQHCLVAGEVSPWEAVHSKPLHWSIQFHLAASCPSSLWWNAARSALMANNPWETSPHSYHAAPQPWLAHFLFYIFTTEK